MFFTLPVRGLEEGATYVFEVESQGTGGGSGRASLQVDPGQRYRSGARAIVLAALVAAILLIAVAVASWHGGRVCGNRKRNRKEQRVTADPADRKGLAIYLIDFNINILYIIDFE